jgi:hypothetical protein
MSLIGLVRGVARILVSLFFSCALHPCVPCDNLFCTCTRIRIYVCAYVCWIYANNHSCTADHVDILGRSSLNELILQVAGGRGELIEETIHSKIREYADKVKIYEEP